jgi:hypothetical protein
MSSTRKVWEHPDSSKKLPDVAEAAQHTPVEAAQHEPVEAAQHEPVEAARSSEAAEAAEAAEAGEPAEAVVAEAAESAGNGPEWAGSVSASFGRTQTQTLTPNEGQR